ASRTDRGAETEPRRVETGGLDGDAGALDAGHRDAAAGDGHGEVPGAAVEVEGPHAGGEPADLEHGGDEEQVGVGVDLGEGVGGHLQREVRLDGDAEMRGGDDPEAPAARQ